MSSEEQRKKVNEFKTELLRLKTMIKAGGTVENPARVRELRKTIARILTVENEPKLEVDKKKSERKKKK
jgi:large subunit ribosomal protein L29